MANDVFADLSDLYDALSTTRRCHAIQLMIEIDEHRFTPQHLPIILRPLRITIHQSTPPESRIKMSTMRCVSHTSRN